MIAASPKAGEPEGQERHPPPVEGFELPGDQDPEHSAHGQPGHEDPHGQGPAVAREIVGDQRGGGRRRRRAAEPDQSSGNEQRGEAHGQAGQSGAEAPKGNPAGDDPAAGPEVAQEA